MNCDKKLGFDSRVLFDCHLDLVLLDSRKRASQSVVARTAHAGFVFRPRNFHLMVLWSILSYCRSALVMPGSLTLHTFVSRLDFTCLSIDIESSLPFSNLTSHSSKLQSQLLQILARKADSDHCRGRCLSQHLIHQEQSNSCCSG